MKQLFLLLPVLFCALPIDAQTWAGAADIPEVVRAGNTAAWSKNGTASLFIVSGRTQNNSITQKLQRYDVTTNTWSVLADHPTGLLGAATTVLNDTLYVVGGVVNPPGAGSNKVYKYSISENTWSQAANFPFGIVDAKAVSYQDSLIYVAGGVGGSVSGKVYVYNCLKNQWRAATPFLPAGNRSFGGFAVKGDTLVYLCGTDGFLSPNYFNTVHVGVINQNNRAQISWSQGAPFPGETRTFFDACTWHNGIILTGGSTDNTFNTLSDECFVYHPGSNTWSQYPDKPTAWLTGQSGSVVLPGGVWKLICASGFAGAYLQQTEIFSELSATSNTQFPENSICTGKEHLAVRNASEGNIHFRYCMPKTGMASLELYDVKGRLLRTLYRGKLEEGEYQLALDTTGLKAGMYFCCFRQNGATIARKFIW